MMTHDEYRIKLGKTLRKRRLMADLTQIALAKKLEVTSSYLSEVESGRRHINSYRIYQIQEFCRQDTFGLHDDTLSEEELPRLQF